MDDASSKDKIPADAVNEDDGWHDVVEDSSENECFIQILDEI